MTSSSFVCSTKFFLVLSLLSAVPIAILISLETAKPPSHTYEIYSNGWLRECTKWDDVNGRFLISFMDGGGIGEIRVPPEREGDYSSPTKVEEVQVVNDVDLAGNASCGIHIDRPRNRLLVAGGDVIRNKYSALAAYDLDTWKRLFLTRLSGEGPIFADDVAVDREGNAYVTDAKGSKIWKVGVDGELLSVITSPLFPAKEWYKNFVTLNGIVYHPNGYLLVVHSFTGDLFKVDLKKDNEVKLVKVESLAIADGMELLSPTKIVVVGAASSKLVESTDSWESARIVGTSPVLKHRVATAVTVKDGKAYISHAIGIGYPKKKHVLLEAVFS